ncbi:MAG: polymer-forming cytoskeletal protein [Lachnospiraceae bacterium]|nr:polymer-forming cytoskeletal protein [Lachnospiraceae bacterium]
MGFFQNLKSDLSDAMNELTDDALLDDTDVSGDGDFPDLLAEFDGEEDEFTDETDTEEVYEDPEDDDIKDASAKLDDLEAFLKAELAGTDGEAGELPDFSDAEEDETADEDFEAKGEDIGNLDLNAMLESIQGELNSEKEDIGLLPKIKEETNEGSKEEAKEDEKTESEIHPVDPSADEVKEETVIREEAGTSDLTDLDSEAAMEAALKAAEEAFKGTETVKDAGEEADPGVSVNEALTVSKDPETADSEKPADNDAEQLAGQMSIEQLIGISDTDDKKKKPVSRKKNTVKKAVTKKETKPEEAALSAELERLLSERTLSDETARFSEGVKINGNIISDGNLELAGVVTGNIDILGKLNISGTVNGITKAGEIYAEGAEMNGDIICGGSVKIGKGAVIIGDMCGTSAVIAGAIKGNIDVRGPVILADTAIVLGNIKSASVQISSGAAVEGMCSQVYAEVSPEDFFKAQSLS